MSCVDVEAFDINSTTFSFRCPFCFSRYKKNGEPYKNAYNIMHRHGSNNDLTNRIEHRHPHCINNKKSFNIHITDNTYRY